MIILIGFRYYDKDTNTTHNRDFYNNKTNLILSLATNNFIQMETKTEHSRIEIYESTLNICEVELCYNELYGAVNICSL